MRTSSSRQSTHLCSTLIHCEGRPKLRRNAELSVRYVCTFLNETAEVAFPGCESCLSWSLRQLPLSNTALTYHWDYPFIVRGILRSQSIELAAACTRMSSPAHLYYVNSFSMFSFDAQVPLRSVTETNVKTKSHSLHRNMLLVPHYVSSNINNLD